MKIERTRIHFSFSDVFPAVAVLGSFKGSLRKNFLLSKTTAPFFFTCGMIYFVLSTLVTELIKDTHQFFH